MIASPTRVQRRPRAGYSLAELIIALGILAVGLSMVATAFLAGAAENSESVQDTMGTLVAENALAVVRARVSDADLVSNSGTTSKMTHPLVILPNLVSPEDLEWDPDREAQPVNVPHQSGLYGCVVLFQRLEDDKNDYRLIVIPFRKFRDSNTIRNAPPPEVEVDDKGMVTKHKVFLRDPTPGAVQPTESADIGCLVYRTALRPS